MKVRSPWISLLTLLMLLGGGVLLIAPQSWFPSFYAPRFMGIGALIFAMVTLSPEWLLEPHTPGQSKAREQLQVHVALSLALSGAGELGLWQLYLIGFEYDKMVHILIPALLTYAFSRFIYTWWETPWKKTVIRTALVILFVSLLWEGVEFYSDQIFGTQLFGVYGEHLSIDTIVDVICDILGIGIVTLVLLRKRFER
jgi:hypothetical protein